MSASVLLIPIASGNGLVLGITNHSLSLERGCRQSSGSVVCSLTPCCRQGRNTHLVTAKMPWQRSSHLPLPALLSWPGSLSPFDTFWRWNCLRTLAVILTWEGWEAEGLDGKQVELVVGCVRCFEFFTNDQFTMLGTLLLEVSIQSIWSLNSFCFLFDGGGHFGLPLVYSVHHSFNTVAVIIYIIYSPKIDLQAGWVASVAQALGRIAQEDFCKLEVSMAYIVSSTPA